MSYADKRVRRETVITVAIGEFLRLGFRRTSMDDVAKRAGISRQGLYLHFRTKDALFKAVVDRLLTDMWTGCQEMFDREDLPVAERLVNAFTAFHGVTVGKTELNEFTELLETAQPFAGPRMRELEQRFVSEVAELLTRTGCAAAWSPAGISSLDLAEHLFVASAGAKYESKTLESYQSRLQLAVRLVTSRG